MPIRKAQMLNWLKKIFAITDEIEELGDDGSGRKFPNIVAAKVLEWKKHPNADRLRVVKLDIGAGRIIDPVVCGAHNFDSGDVVALALPGAHIPQNIHSEAHEPFTLGSAKIRGIESQGMICAAFELGLTKEPGQPAILILRSDTKLGSEFRPEMIQ